MYSQRCTKYKNEGEVRVKYCVPSASVAVGLAVLLLEFGVPWQYGIYHLHVISGTSTL